MPESLTAVFVAYPVVTLFVVIGLGYLIGEINLFGFRLGVAGVLFAGLAVGSLGPSVALPEFTASLGLIIFVYTMGIQSGPAFFESFRKGGARDTLFTAAVLVLGAVITIIFARLFGISGAHAVGLFCGALTNTPALAAAGEWLQHRGDAALAEAPVVGYSVAYPLGVAGVLVCFQLLRRIWPVEPSPPQESREIRVRDFRVVNPGVIGSTVGQVLGAHHGLGFVVSRVLPQGGEVDVARDDMVLRQGDIVAIVGDDTALDRARQIFGAPNATAIELDHSVLRFRRFFVSSKQVVGKHVKELDLPNRFHATITRVLRGDADVVATPETRLEVGDRVRVVARPEKFPALAQFLGDSMRSAAEADFGSVAVGMVLGVMAGSLPIPVPGGATVKLGLAGGPLLVALILGKIGRTGRLSWVMPVSANLALRQIGLLLFLAGVGTRSGYSFVTTVGDTGVRMLLAGAAVTFGVTLVTLLVGYRVLRIPYDALLGLASGVQTQPACLSFAVNETKSEAPNVAYAAVYPTAMIVKIILAQLLLALLVR
jgi:putative transport protein